MFHFAWYSSGGQLSTSRASSTAASNAGRSAHSSRVSRPRKNLGCSNAWLTHPARRPRMENDNRVSDTAVALFISIPAGMQGIRRLRPEADTAGNGISRRHPTPAGVAAPAPFCDPCRGRMGFVCRVSGGVGLRPQPPANFCDAGRRRCAIIDSFDIARNFMRSGAARICRINRPD